MLQDHGEPLERQRAQPPTADQVPYCPPHWWVIEEEWQHCRKCGEERPVRQVEAVLEPEVERGIELESQQEEDYAAENV